MQKSLKPTWIYCKNCGHKLLKLMDGGGTHIETKCHSCKNINEILIDKGDNKYEKK